MIDKKLRGYLVDSIVLLKKQAIEAKKDADNPKKGFENYTKGVLMGYYSIVSLLKHQAFVFCMDQRELGLADIKPDIDLLGLQSRPGIDLEEDNWAIDVINEERIKGYLVDLIFLLKKQAIEVKNVADNSKEGFEDYSKGEVMSYCLVISLLKNQAFTFNINESEFGLADINPEADLLGFRAETDRDP